jgi:hypothetical protein
MAIAIGEIKSGKRSEVQKKLKILDRLIRKEVKGR